MLKRALDTRDRYQWLGVRHQFASLYHERRRADDAIREARAGFDAADGSEATLPEDAELDLDSVAVQAGRKASIDRERMRRRHMHRRKTS